MAGPKRFETDADAERYQWECVEIEPLVLSEEFARVPSDLAYWNERYASAYRLWLEAKSRREQSYAERLESLRLELMIDRKADPLGGAKVTVKEVEAAVERDRIYLAAKDREIETETEKVRLWGVVDAIRTKRDMLVSLGAHQRAEMEADISIRERPRRTS